jgi:hypothetical protein
MQSSCAPYRSARPEEAHGPIVVRTVQGSFTQEYRKTSPLFAPYSLRSGSLRTESDREGPRGLHTAGGNDRDDQAICDLLLFEKLQIVGVSLFLQVFLRDESERSGVDTVAHSRWCRPVAEEMPEVGICLVAPHFCADHRAS